MNNQIEATSALVSDGDQLVLYRPSSEVELTDSDQLLEALYYWLEAHPIMQEGIRTWYANEKTKRKSMN